MRETLKDEIVSLLKKNPGLMDREITNLLRGVNEPQQPINVACRELEREGVIERVKRRPNDNFIGNYLVMSPSMNPTTKASDDSQYDLYMEEDEVKKIINDWLIKEGWSTQVAWGRERGVDIDALKGSQRWLLEVKGAGSSQPMRKNYFLSMLGELLERMNDPNARYSIVLPDIQQFRRLWTRLPLLAKQRTGIDAIFINRNGKIEFTDE